jgi:hypothetical protein
MFNKGTKNIQWGKDSFLNKQLDNTRYPPTCKIIELGPYLTPYIKINSKWIKDLNIRPLNYKTTRNKQAITLTLYSRQFFDDLNSTGNKDKTDI